MKSLMDDVRAFHEACDLPVLDKPTVPQPERQLLRGELVREEHSELFAAWCKNDLVGMADAIADLIYVLVGMALEYGIPLDKVWDAVQAANMAKVDTETGKVRKREDGKVLKPENWQAPDIAGILAGASIMTESELVPEAFYEGVDAFGVGTSPGHNPYEPGTVEYGSWDDGWWYACWEENDRRYYEGKT